MSKRFQAAATITLKDPDADRARRSADVRIRELQAVPVVQGNLVRDIALADGDAVYVPHGLGHPATVLLSAVRATSAATTGRVREYRGPEVDRSVYFLLKAQGWGETVYVDAWVF